MAKINPDPRFPVPAPTENDWRKYAQRLVGDLIRFYRDVAFQVDALSEGGIRANYAASTAAPTAGTFQQGDKVYHSAPVDVGSAGSKYVVVGWVCVSAGTPGTWKEMRVLTGE